MGDAQSHALRGAPGIVIKQAFVLGAGLGTRLRPLTESLPKPLVPIFQKPLITFAFDHLIAAGCAKLVANTHHQPMEFARAFPQSNYRDVPILFRHEETLLETGGGIANVADLLGNEPFIVYNADILTDLPLEVVIAEHLRTGNLVTLALRSTGGPRHIAFDERSHSVIDIRNQLGTGATDEFVFTGIYVVDPKFLRRLENGVKRSVIPTFLDVIRAGEQLGGVVVDEGHWWDVGNREAYLQLHRDLPTIDFPRYGAVDANWREPVHASAIIETGARLLGCSVVGANCKVAAGAILDDSILWPGAQLAAQSHLRNCIVRFKKTAQGVLSDVDI